MQRESLERQGRAGCELYKAGFLFNNEKGNNEKIPFIIGRENFTCVSISNNIIFIIIIIIILYKAGF